ncbi:4Fe-4S dicluster domain-containing protein [Flavisphingomonas formosensis]|uniref:4Fe-4S dicluster domain-containing protein n=1 Tax=Flavisphingomonas formosensis TaxID=861534 RepID=UPI0012F9AD5E|nr:4Fe-4S dicluster domain-containing protein [Sphingomonas formosensis]
MSATILTRGTVTIDIALCKGCELCIPACPIDVLTMSEARNDRGEHYPELAPGCTGCGACYFVCPDFVFGIYEYETPKTISVPEGAAS